MQFGCKTTNFILRAGQETLTESYLVWALFYLSKMLSQSTITCVSVVRSLKLKLLGENIFPRRMAGGTQPLITPVGPCAKYVELSSIHAEG